MRMTRLFSRTLRDAPADAATTGHQLLVRAGFIRQSRNSGQTMLLPLARRTLDKIEAIIRAEMAALNGQAMALVLNRELMVELMAGEINSYRQLPQLLYQILLFEQPSPNGLPGMGDEIMHTSYSLDADEQGLDQHYRAHYQAYFNIFNRCGLRVLVAKAMGGSLAHEFVYMMPKGDDSVILCDCCGYKANQQAAIFHKPKAAEEAPLPLEKVATPDANTIAALAEFMDVPAAKTAKAVFMVAGEADGERFVFAVVRGDMEVNRTKLAQAVGAVALRPAVEDEIRAVGADPGYASPVGLKDVLVVVDDAIVNSPNLIAGANETGYHLRNVNYGRDYQATIVADIALAKSGDACTVCQSPLRIEHGAVMGRLTMHGARYDAATYLDQNGKARPVQMGEYRLDIGRLLAGIAEANNDKYGLLWPVSVAPYQVQLVRLKDKSGEVAKIADQLYAELQAAGIEVLYDDRSKESPGVRFNDADLIGLPLRLTVGGRSLEQGGIEFKHRIGKDRIILPQDEVLSTMQAEIDKLYAMLERRVTKVPFTG